LVDDGLKVTDEVGKLGTKGGVNGYPDCLLNDAGNEDICKGNALANKERAGREVGVEGFEGTRLPLNETSVCLDLIIVKFVQGRRMDNAYGFVVREKSAADRTDVVSV